MNSSYIRHFQVFSCLHTYSCRITFSKIFCSLKINKIIIYTSISIVVTLKQDIYEMFDTIEAYGIMNS